MVFWGPPGTGKTTLARLIARYTDREFVPFSAVTEGVPRVREIVREAEDRLADWDAARSCSPTRSIASTRRSRTRSCRTSKRERSRSSARRRRTRASRSTARCCRACACSCCGRSLADDVAGVDPTRARRRRARAGRARTRRVDDDAIELLATEADGDARRALTVLEAASEHVGDGGHITVDVVRDAAQLRFSRYDKGGEETYNILSAFHKVAARQRSAGGAVLDGAHDRRRRRIRW